ncbi:MAG TPA: hypothetical protein VNY05_32965 [Candidatus Acidoferrales bacterium]|nr:hypothetical protein [Candidatus Acidoferrales bacterium]
MFKKLVLAFAVLSIAAAGAATGYKITITQAAVVKGNQLKAGDYRLNVEESKVTIANGKESVQVPVQVENNGRKFDTTAISYTEEGGQQNIREIRIGGTRTKLIFNR